VRNTPLTFEERQWIETLLKEGITLTAISKRLGRSKNAIVSDVRKNGGREEYTAEKSWRRKEEKHEAHRELLRKLNKGKTPPAMHYDLRLSALEMQMQIVIEELTKGKK